MIRAEAVKRALQHARIPFSGSDRVIHIHCPFHADAKTPSLAIYTDKGAWFCFGCLEHSELIWTDKGLTEIGNIVPGDQVLTHKGTLSPVLAKQVKYSRSNVQVKLGSFRLPLVMTDDHTCLRIPRASAQQLPYLRERRDGYAPVRFSRSKSRRIRLARQDGDAGWLAKYYVEPTIQECRADELQPWDFVLFPVISTNVRNDVPLYEQSTLRPYTKGPKTPRLLALPVNAALAWLYGLYLAEGSLRRGVVTFTCHIDESDTLLKRAKTIVAKYLGWSSTITKYPDKHTSELYVCKTDFVAQLRHWFGHLAHGKKIPGAALHWAVATQRALINGYMAGDADRKTHRQAQTVSKKLAYGLYALGIQCGRYPSLGYQPPRTDTKGVRHRASGQLRYCEGPRTAGAFCSLQGNRYYITPISSVKKDQRNRCVVDISVAGAETFVAKSCAVHNCGKHGSWEGLADALHTSKELEISFDQGASGRLVKYLKTNVTRQPKLPPGISPWSLGPWRGFGVDVLTSVHSLWWYDEASRARRVLWPIWGRDETLIGWTSRLLDKVEDAPKYRNLPRMAALQTMWPVPTRDLDKLDRDVVVIVEGIPDTIRLLNYGIPAISNLGTTWSHTRTSLIADLEFKEIVVSCDGDAAGRKANLKIGYTLRQAFGSRVKVWEWSDSTDPGDAPEFEVAALREELQLPHRPHAWLRCLPPLLTEWSL